MLSRATLATFLACFALYVDAATSPASGRSDAYRVTHWAAGDNGLPQNSAKALAQSRDGYLWVGTLYGLARFDGLRFEVFDHANTPAFSTEAIDSVVVDVKDDSLWVQSRDRLIHFIHRSFEVIADDNKPLHLDGSIWPGSQGGVWCSTGRGQLLWAGEGKIRRWDLGTDRSFSVKDVIDLGWNLLMLRLDFTLYEFNPETSSLRRIDMPRATGCLSISSDGPREFWISTDNGIWAGAEGNWKLISTRRPAGVDLMFMLYKNSHGCFRCGRDLTDGNPIFDRLDPESGRYEPFAIEGLPEQLQVSKILEDREGNLWIGSTDGLFRLQRKSLQVISRKNGLRNDDVLASAVDPDGNLWIGTHNGVSVRHNGVITNLPEPRRLEYSAVGVLWPDRDGFAWCGAIEGLFKQWPDGRRESWPCLDGKEACFIKSVFKDSRNRLWTSTGDEVQLLENNQWRRFSTNSGLASTDIRVFFEDSKGVIWAGSFGRGLFRFDNGRFTGYCTDRGDYNNRAWWIHEDSDGVFWIGSQDGLNRFEHGQFFTFTQQHGLFETVVNNIQEDEFGNLWLSGLTGIYKVSRRELNEVASGKRSQVRCIAYGEAEGMLNRECNGGDNQPGGCKDAEGHIYFATARGVVIIDPRDAPRNDVPPSPIIEDMKLDDRLVIGYAPASERNVGAQFNKDRLGTPTRFPPGHGNLVVSYTGVSLTAPEKVRFKYRLHGIDSQWVDAGTRRIAYYHNLLPGDYRFEVMAANSHGVWSETSTPVSFKLAPHFYQTWIFYLLCAGMIAGPIGALQVYRLKWQRRLVQIEQQRVLAQERTRIARDLHDDLGTALTGLALELDVAGKDAGQGTPIDTRLARTADRTRDLAERMREVVWTVNPRCDTVSSLADFLEQQVTQFLRAPGVTIRLNFPEDIPVIALGADARHQLALSAREALTNVVRHSHATEVNVRLAIAADSVELEIQDNGRGFDVAGGHGNGLSNMRARMAQVGGSFECCSAAGSGAVLRFRIPLDGAALSSSQAQSSGPANLR